MEEDYFQEINLPAKTDVGHTVPCLYAEVGRYKKSLIFICREGKGIKVPKGIPGFEDGYLCCATCFKQDTRITPDSYIDTSRMKYCPSINE
jgi:hypothetical protein